MLCQEEGWDRRARAFQCSQRLPACLAFLLISLIASSMACAHDPSAYGGLFRSRAGCAAAYGGGRVAAGARLHRASRPLAEPLAGRVR